MPKISDTPVSPYIKAIFKGEPGTRKSVESFYFPEPIYIFDFDGKIDVAQKHVPRKDIEYDTYDFADPKMLIDKINQKLESIQLQNQYKTVILDSVTALVMKVLRYTLSFRSREGKDKSKQVGDILLPEFDDFNAESNVLATIIQFAKIIPCHTIIVAHVTPDSKGINRRIFTAGRAAAAMLPALFNEVYHFQESTPVGEPGKVYQVFTQNTGTDFARTALTIPERININEGGNLFKEITKAKEEMERIKKAQTIK